MRRAKTLPLDAAGRPNVARPARSRPAAPDGPPPDAPAASETAPKPARKAAAKAAPGKGKRKPKAVYAPAEVEAIFARFRAANPEPKGELEHVNAFTLLVAVVLSAQATDAGVNKATRPLFQVADTPQAMLALGEDGVREAIKSIGLFRTKAKNVIALSEALIRDHGGVVPEDRTALEKLPGVGRKTANVVLNMAFGQPTFAVDTHIFRLGNRLLLAPGKDPLAVELAFEAIVPEPYRLHAHHWLILHGRYVCKARKPECERCVIYDLCKSPERRVVDRQPDPMDPGEPDPSDPAAAS
ncbi:endonuclease III [Mongoliimonas terrestris]|uniref:endonuclease III n=1 Tax=Mongoliimonas terrestris TaxID=1709001 RepID=UPI0009FB67F3|nr:endonuclease III [Mongoliimonas terrestris]